MANLTEELVRASTLARLDAAVRTLRSGGLEAWSRVDRTWFVSLLNVKGPDDCHLGAAVDVAPSYSELLLRPIVEDLARGSEGSRESLHWMIQFCHKLLESDPAFGADDTERAIGVMMRLRRSIMRHRLRSDVSQRSSGTDLF